MPVKRQLKLNPFVMPILAIAVLFGTIFTAQAMGVWSTSGREAINPETMTAADLKGWMTLQDVMDGLDISQSDLYAAGKIPLDVPTSTALNKLESLVPGFSVTGLRDALSGKAAAVPATTKSETAASAGSAATPAPVVAATPTPAATSAARGTDGGTGTGPTPLPSGQILPANQIKGSMTLRSVSQQCAVPLNQLLAQLKLPADVNPDTSVKELVSQGKIAEVTVVQKVVAGLQAK